MLASNYALEFVSYPMQVKLFVLISVSFFLKKGFREISKTCPSYAIGCIDSEKAISISEIFVCFINCSWYELVIIRCFN
jgi:hypothetical protein